MTLGLLVDAEHELGICCVKLASVDPQEKSVGIVTLILIDQKYNFSPPVAVHVIRPSSKPKDLTVFLLEQ